jgi:hypothetical protein
VFKRLARRDRLADVLAGLAAAAAAGLAPVKVNTRAVAVKLPGHGINNPGFLQPSRPMSAIGG